MSTPEFQEYILVEQSKSHIYQYKKTNKGWLLTEYASLEKVLVIKAIDLQIPLSEIYDLVESI